MKGDEKGRCSTGACVDIKMDGTDFLFTSTKGEARGVTRYDRDEVAVFFSDVKTGRWDHLLYPDGPSMIA